MTLSQFAGAMALGAFLTLGIQYWYRPAEVVEVVQEIEEDEPVCLYGGNGEVLWSAPGKDC